MTQETIDCDKHGEASRAYVCHHLVQDSCGLGFNCNDSSPENPYPDAWCDHCEIVRSAHGGWNENSEKLTTISLVCSRCYEQIRIRNTRSDFTLEQLADYEWKCSTCDEVHSGPCLSFGCSQPYYWREDLEADENSFLNEDYCVVEKQHFFIRGVIRLPIIGTLEHFEWGAWGSISEANAKALARLENSTERVGLGPMFSWMSSELAPDYPSTLSLKLQAHIQPPGLRPLFEVERTDHPLAKEYYEGISPRRVKEIMIRQLGIKET